MMRWGLASLGAPVFAAIAGLGIAQRQSDQRAARSWDNSRGRSALPRWRELKHWHGMEWQHHAVDVLSRSPSPPRPAAPNPSAIKATSRPQGSAREGLDDREVLRAAVGLVEDVEFLLG